MKQLLLLLLLPFFCFFSLAQNHFNSNKESHIFSSLNYSYNKNENGYKEEEEEEEPTLNNCSEYNLENECTSFLQDGTSLSEERQERVFLSLQTNISNIRMFPSSCRRPLLWYICKEAFPSCHETKEDRLCRLVDGCLQLEQICDSKNYSPHSSSSSFSFNCSSLLNNTSILEDSDLQQQQQQEQEQQDNISNNCTSKITNEIEMASQNPVEVQTCLDQSDKTIQCCPTPFTVSEDGECVIACPQFQYQEDYEKNIGILCLVFTCLGFFCVFLSYFPLFMMGYPVFSYPNYQLGLGLFSFSVWGAIETFPPIIYGVDDFICGGEVSWEKGVLNFGTSTRAGMQAVFDIAIVTFSLSQFSIMSFNSFCLMSRNKFLFLEKFVKRPVPKWIERGTMAISVGSSIFCGVFYLVYFFNYTDKTVPSFSPTPFTFAAQDIRSPYSVFYAVVLLSTVGLVLILLVLSVVFLLSINYQMIYFQWRSLFVSFWVACNLYYTFASIFAWGPLFDKKVHEYAECVALHPQMSSPPCNRDYNSGVDNGLFILILFSSTPVNSMVVVFSTPEVYRWWLKLFVEGEVVRTIHDQLSSLRETNSTSGHTSGPSLDQYSSAEDVPLSRHSPRKRRSFK